MFSKQELEGTKDYIELKKGGVLNRKGGSDFDYIRDLQTLILLGNAVEEKLEERNKF